MNPPQSKSDESSPTDTPAPDALTAEGVAVASRQLQYVDVAAPKAGRTVELAPGVSWCRMPLAGDLDHINVWLVDTGDGHVLVDTGLAAAPAKDAWEDIERDVLAARPLRAIFITHVHPDHLGLAAWLQERHRVPVWMSQRTYDQAQFLLGLQGTAEPADGVKFFRSNGVMDLSSLEPYFVPGRFAKITSGMPKVERMVEDGEVLHWGGRAWAAIETNGHADGHLCLSDVAGGLLISGDQVLPTISSNIALTWRNRDLNPLDSFLTSLRGLRELPEATLVLPSHGLPFRGLQQRIDDLLSHHEGQLDSIVRACAEPKTAAEVLPAMFRRRLTGMQLLLALAEALAHLEYLVQAARLQRRTDAQGAIRYAA
jgi:glyoxylase-like metal-dependent hydrolase (beta-lactamase superfamily II)